MTYRPERRISFGPPLRDRLPALGYFAFAIIACAVPSSVCAIILFTSASAAVLREQMRGVVLHPEGIEMRELLTLGWPRVRRLTWSQIDRVFVPPAKQEGAEAKSIRLDLWDGSRTWLPKVARADELGILLERVALARAIPLEGGTGMVDEIGNPLTEEG
jgi:hypothetical protein